MLSLPMIALRGILVFPQMTVSVDIERETSIQAASAAAQGDHLVFVCMQKRAEEESPAARPADLRCNSRPAHRLLFQKLG